MYHYFLTICWHGYPFHMISNAPLSRYQSDLLSPEEKMVLKGKQYFHNKQRFSKGQMSISLFYYYP